MLRATRTVSAAWFRRNIRPVEQPNRRDTWDAAEASLLSDPLEARRVDELAAELSRNGFQRAVVVGRHRWWQRRRVCDGMHRSMAAMRLGIDIPIRGDHPAEADCDEDIYTVTSTSIDIDGLLDAAMSLSSWRSSAGPWIQSDVASAYNATVRLYLPRHPELRPLITAELTDRAHRPAPQRRRRGDGRVPGGGRGGGGLSWADPDFQHPNCGRIAGKIGRVYTAGVTPSPDSLRLRALLAAHDEEVRRLISRRGATNPRLFGSVAAGSAVDDSDIDLMVDFVGQSPGEQLMNSTGLAVELSDALGVHVDVLVLDYAKSAVSEAVSSGSVLAL